MKSFVLLLPFFLSAFTLSGADTAKDRMKDATEIFNEIMMTPDKGIPQDLLDKAHCVVIVPGLKQAAFVVGGKYGRGFTVCRNAGGWGAPGAVRLEGRECRPPTFPLG